MKRALFLCTALPCLWTVLCPTVTTAQPNRTGPPIKELAGLTLVPRVFEAASLERPLVLRRRRDATRFLPAESLAKLAEMVDFRQQYLVIFAWQGSSRDKLEYSVLESFPEQIVFVRQRGRTRDLKRHTRVFALRSNVNWRVQSDRGNGGGAANDMDEYIKVEVGGQLSSNVMAIGGETTGVVVEARGVRWELDLGRDVVLQRKARQLNGKLVVVKGQLEAKPGVEIARRWIVSVESLEAAARSENRDSDGDAGNEYLTSAGQLKGQLRLRDSQSGFAGETGRVWTIEPDGRWQRQPFVNARSGAPESSGQLDRDQLKQLADAMAKHRLATLPERMGNRGVNPRVVQITFLDRQVSLIGSAGARLPADDDASVPRPQRLFAGLARAILRAVSDR